MDSKLISFIICALLSFCDGAYVDTINKCSFKDDECVRKLIQKVMGDMGSSGIPEFNIPPIDPMDLSGLSVPILGLLNISVEEGSLTGVKDCMIKNIHNDLEARVTDLDLLCDLAITTKFKLNEVSPVVQQLFGASDISGNGDMMLNIDKIRIKMKFFYDIIKKDDGNVYFDLHHDDLIANFNIGNLKLKANKIFIGKQDVGDFIENLFNNNWKSLMSTFGTSIFEVAVTIVKGTLGKFFDNVPTKYYYIDDITPYVNKA